MKTELTEIEIDILEFLERGEPVPAAHAYHVRIDCERFKVDTDRPTGQFLLELVRKRPCAYELISEFNHCENQVVEPHETVDLRQHGLKGFLTAHKEIVTVFFGDQDTPFHIERGEHSVAEIMAVPKDGKTPEGYDLYIEKPGKPPIQLPDNKPVKIEG